MKLLDKKEMSQWAFFQCKDGNDTPEMRNLIEDDEYIYAYCYHIKDIEEMWKKLKSKHWSFWYCLMIKDRPEVRVNCDIKPENYSSFF